MRELRSDAGVVFGACHRALEALMGWLLGLQCLRTGGCRCAESACYQRVVIKICNVACLTREMRRQCVPVAMLIGVRIEGALCAR